MAASPNVTAPAVAPANASPAVSAASTPAAEAPVAAPMASAAGSAVAPSVAPAPVSTPVLSTATASGAAAASATPALTEEEKAEAAQKEAEKNNLLNHKRINVAVIILILFALVTYYTQKASAGKEMFIRRISGLAAIDDAVGRATEMGRGVLFIPGIMDMDDIQTIAGVTILGHVAKKTAEYDTALLAPMTRAFTMSVAQEVVYQSYVEKGRKDAYRKDRINYLTDDQFGFVAGVGGIMMREKPAACFYLGTFYAESLILAETGNSVGAIQIAGTAEPSQIPFFVAACDYTLIGEELFAASAYLSRNPEEVGSLKGQDASKLMIILMIVIGVFLVTVSRNLPGDTTTAKSAANFYLDLLKTE
ncbi:MAG TPA: hypothetical protein PKO06_17545 [Candidatus Ozemobacteraceae bacterium]|nr:hypothetical protein [Candidatus Ozemobacteraceae bacterium]